MKFKSLTLGGVLLALGISAHADDSGRAVLLCLANPAGPMVAECVSPITKLYRDPAKGKALPTCEIGSALDTHSGQSSTTHGVSYYDACPMDERALESGAYAVNSASSTSYYLGIGEVRNCAADTLNTVPSKICVNKCTGDTSLTMVEGEGMAGPSAGVFEAEVVIAPNTQRHYVDVYMSSAFLHRARW